MGRSMDELSARFRPLADALIGQANASGLDVVVISTGRTLEEHRINLARGKSWAKHSKHMDGDAIDLCPRSLLSTPNWSPESDMWELLGILGEGLGMTWGGRWMVKDMGHFEYKEVGQ
jgi:hypothetical protein